MALVELAVRQLHQGVSRQPHHARLVGQLQDANNSIFRIETAGFSKRYGSQVVGLFDFTPNGGVEIPFHIADFSTDEKYGITIDNAGGVRVMGLLDGQVRTVNQTGATQTYLTASDASQYAFVTILNWTMIVNKTVEVAMTAALAPSGTHAAVIHIADGRPGDYKITVDGVTSVSHTTLHDDATTWDTSDIAAQLSTALGTALGANFSVGRRGGSYILVHRVDLAPFTVEVEDPAGGLGVIVSKTDGFLDSSDRLPPYAISNMVVTIGAPNSEANYYLKFVEGGTSGSNEGHWEETIAAGVPYEIDATTMPHILIRNSDGTFTVQAADWDDREVGDEDSVPNPDFIGQTINDIVLFKGRLGLLSGEWNWFSAPKEYLRFWPRRSTQALDDDPFGLPTSDGRPSIQHFGVPFRKILWTTADLSQFEISTPTLLTQKQAVIDGSTSYLASPYARPVKMAQMLYFSSFNGKDAIILEYSYDYLALTAVATEITKHARGYVPHPVLWMAADPPTGNLFVRSQSEPSKIWVWTVFWAGTEREQSAWSQWTFEGAFIHGGTVAAGNLFLLVSRGTELWIEQVPLDIGVSGFAYSPRLDQLTAPAGVFDGTNTTYTLPYDAEGVTGVLATGQKVNIASTSGNDVIVSGDSGTAAFGFTYPSECVLSKQYHRDEKGNSVVYGEMTLSEILVAHEDTGFYEVVVNQQGRDEQIYRFTGGVFGAPHHLMGNQPIASGTFRKPIGADGTKATISIRNDTHLPHTISLIVFRGQFNETVRAG